MNKRRNCGFTPGRGRPIGRSTSTWATLSRSAPPSLSSRPVRPSDSRAQTLGKSRQGRPREPLLPVLGTDRRHRMGVPRAPPAQHRRAATNRATRGPQLGKTDRSPEHSRSRVAHLNRAVATASNATEEPFSCGGHRLGVHSSLHATSHKSRNKVTLEDKGNDEWRHGSNYSGSSHHSPVGPVSADEIIDRDRQCL
jgi:hypothetical protein